MSRSVCEADPFTRCEELRWSEPHFDAFGYGRFEARVHRLGRNFRDLTFYPGGIPSYTVETELRRLVPWRCGGCQREWLQRADLCVAHLDWHGPDGSCVDSRCIGVSGPRAAEHDALLEDADRRTPRWFRLERP